jgi:hypothetical protein
VTAPQPPKEYAFANSRQIEYWTIGAGYGVIIFILVVGMVVTKIREWLGPKVVTPDGRSNGPIDIVGVVVVVGIVVTAVGSALLARAWCAYRHSRAYRRAIEEYERNRPGLEAAYAKAVAEYEKSSFAYELSEAKLLWDVLLAVRQQVYDYWPDYPPDWEERWRAVLRRDGYKCTQCGAPRQPGCALQAHHKRKLRLGGSNRLENLTTLCETCHAKSPGHEHMR